MRLMMAAVFLLAGCTMFSAQAREQARKDAAQQSALKGKVERVLSDLKRPLKGKLWDSVKPYYFQDDMDAFKALKLRTDAMWKRGQLLELDFTVKSVTRERDTVTAVVSWERSLLERGQILKEEGKCELFFKRVEDAYLLYGAARDGCFF